MTVILIFSFHTDSYLLPPCHKPYEKAFLFIFDLFDGLFVCFPCIIFLFLLLFAFSSEMNTTMYKLIRVTLSNTLAGWKVKTAARLGGPGPLFTKRRVYKILREAYIFNE